MSEAHGHGGGTDHKWIKCNSCGNETHVDLSDCICEVCEELDWSEPYDYLDGPARR